MDRTEESLTTSGKKFSFTKSTELKRDEELCGTHGELDGKNEWNREIIEVTKIQKVLY